MAAGASGGRFTSRIISTVGPRVRALLLTLGLVGASISAEVSKPLVDTPAVHPVFDLSAPAGSPFPSDRFTVPDPDQNTGRRVALPMPADCAGNRSDCDDITVLNELDGFNQHPRVSIPFDGDIDIDQTSVTPETVFIVSVPDFDEQTWLTAPPMVDSIRLTRIVWDPETRTLHARADEALQEHTRYAIVVTRGVRDATGQSIGPSESFLNLPAPACDVRRPTIGLVPR
jgi:Bacterial virulence factor lipase N-terminal